MKILIVAPDVGLNVVQDIIAASSGNSPHVLHGMVSVAHVLAEIETGAYDALHFASHGNRHGLLMSDDFIDVYDLQSAFSRAARAGKKPEGVKIVMLNACDSSGVAIDIYTSGENPPPYVISWEGEVLDGDAGYFAERFYRELTSHGDIKRAYDVGATVLRRRNPESVLPKYLNGRTDAHILARQQKVLIEQNMERQAKREEEACESSARNRFYLVILSIMFALMVALTIFVSVTR